MKTTGIMITIAAIALCGSVSAQQQGSAGTITGINRLTGTRDHAHAKRNGRIKYTRA